jgi:starch synthase
VKIALVTSEIVPFAKTGGLADVAGALGKYLSLDGQDVRIFTPLYDISDTASVTLHPVDYLQEITLDIGGELIVFSVRSTRLPDGEADIYFIDAPRLYHRGKVYTDDDDEYLRFALLSRAAIECCQRMAWAPDVFHWCSVRSTRGTRSSATRAPS